MTSAPLHTLFNQAFAAHQAGKVDDAESNYRLILQQEPDHADTQHLLGVILLQRGEPHQAETLIRQSLARIPNFAAAHNNLGMVLETLQRPADAEASYRHAISLEPDYGDAWYNLGNVLTARNHLDEAETAYRRAIELKPESPEIQGNLALLLEKRGDQAAAESAYREALRLGPGNQVVRINLANLLLMQGCLEEAEQHYTQILQDLPDSAPALNGIGNIHNKRGEIDQARGCYERAIQTRPDDANIHNNLGSILQKQGLLPEAEAEYRQAIALDSESVAIIDNLAMCLREMARFEEAEAQHRRALEIAPDFAQGYINLGYLLQQCNRFEEAEALYLQALRLRPGDIVARLNLSLLRLAQGRFTEAWPDFEARLDSRHDRWSITPPDVAFPPWRGEPLAGRSIVVWHEQGMGDEIIFCRYATELKQAGAAHVSLVCKPPLKTLMQTLKGVDVVLSDGDQLCPHDYWGYPMTLPAGFGTTVDTIPAHIPYLYAAPDRMEAWRARLSGAGLKVGLVWRGQPRQPNNATRSLDSLQQLAPLWRTPGVTFFSLQKGEGEEEASSPPPGQPLIHLGGELGDFADTAAVIAQLDLVISVCTATAHLAGAMGKTCWVLTPAMNTFWLWLLDRTDSPWYPGVLRLFRQTRPLDWTQTIEQVATALQQWTHERSQAAHPTDC